MTLSSGTFLGPYQIIAPLGAGGMGEVYRARDTRLDRSVAIKVLPGRLAANLELRQRFEREARAVSILNHPHICTLHDIGRQDGLDYLVMELIEGESLADRLTQGPLPADRVLRYAIQIADAMDKAHRAGIVHRDLKPANIMLTKSGTKLLDFGLAKLKVPEESTALSAMPTHADVTAKGAILGTLQYMAPEQLEGRKADSRTDIFAFGAVVYEMATGRKAFTGKSQASLIGAILHSEPVPISTTQRMTPLVLDRVVKRCLAKDPDDRWQSARDLTMELGWVAVGSRDPKTGTQDIHVIDLARGTSLKLTFDPANDRSPIWSPDGSRIVWSSNRGGTYGLYQKPASGVGQDELLLKSDVNSLPTHWSADGRFILYERDDPKTKRDLWVLPLEGDRKPFPFLQTPFDERSGRFSPDGRWIAYDSDESGKREVYVQTFPASGGK